MRAAVVTGAGGYLGRYIAGRLLAQGQEVRSLTGHPERLVHPPGRIRAIPYRFEDPAVMARAIEGADVLYNTYWVRFERGAVTHDRAVRQSVALFEAARLAGVGRVVHISVTNPDAASQLSYFRGKANVEHALEECGLPYAILRPALLFGGEDILINNIAWLLRHVPVFGLPDGGGYRLQPAFVDDVAALAVERGLHGGPSVSDAVGPEVFTFAELVETVRNAVGAAARVVPIPVPLALAAVAAAGLVLRDVVLTGEELRGLMSNSLVSAAEPTCPTRFSAWVLAHGLTLGATYHSELARHYA
jgi:uncharacterized protein YbjT (DUF2867 family)